MKLNWLLGVVLSERCRPDVSHRYKNSTCWKHCHSDDDDCNSDSRDHAPSVCLDDLFQLCNLDSCFRGEGPHLLGSQALRPSVSAPLWAPCALNREAGMTQAQQMIIISDLFRTRVNTACALEPTADLAQTGKNWWRPIVNRSWKVESKHHQIKCQLWLQDEQIWFQRSKVTAVVWKW